MSFKEFASKNKISLFFFSLFVSLVYLPLVFESGYYTDVEYIINNSNSFYNWSELGRFSLILIKQITGLSRFNPYLEAICFTVAIVILLIATAYLFSSLAKNTPGIVCFASAALFIVFPTFTEQFLFAFQSFEIVIGMLLIVISCILLSKEIRDLKYPLLIIAIILTTLSFGIYQSMQNNIITMYFGMFVLMLFTEEKKTIGRGAFLCTVHFISSFSLNKIICMLFCEEGSYFADKIMWKVFPFETCFHMVKHYIRTVLLAEKYMYTYSFLISICLALAALVFVLIRKKAKALLFIPGIAGIIISPFIIAIIQGFEPDARTQLALPLSIAFLFIFSYFAFFEKSSKEENPDNKIAKVFSIILITASFAMLFLNLSKTERLVYSRQIISKSDEANVLRIASDLKEFNCSASDSSSVPVIIIGTIPTAKNRICYEYNDENKDYILTSVFNLDANEEPKYFFSTNRILGYMEMLGYDYNKPSVSNYMEDAYAVSNDMPVFPSEGYIKETENFVVVNLSK